MTKCGQAAVFAIAIGILVGLVAAASVSFTSPTPDDGATVTVNFVALGFSVASASSSPVVVEWTASGVPANQTPTCSGADPSLSCTLNMTGLANGNYAYRVFANDTNDAGSWSAQRTVAVNVTAPTPTPTPSAYFLPSVGLQSPTPSNATVLNQTFVTVNASVTTSTGLGPIVLEWTFWNANGNPVNTNYTMGCTTITSSLSNCVANATGLIDGNYTFFVYASDASGNVTVSPTVFAKISTYPTPTPLPGLSGTPTPFAYFQPVAYLQSPTPANGAALSQNFVPVNATVGAVHPTFIMLAFTTVGVNGNTRSVNYPMACIPTSDTFFYCHYNATNLADGSQTFYVFSNDTMGNMGVSETRTVTTNTGQATPAPTATPTATPAPTPTPAPTLAQAANAPSATPVKVEPTATPIQVRSDSSNSKGIGFVVGVLNSPLALVVVLLGGIAGFVFWRNQQL